LSEEARPQQPTLELIDSTGSVPGLEPLPPHGEPPIFTEPPRHSAWHHILIGPSGLRPGWGLLLYILLIIGLSAGIEAVVHKFHHPVKPAAQGTNSGDVVPQSPTTVLMVEGLSFSMVAFATWIMSRVERRRLGSYGFGGNRKFPSFFAGLFWGAIFLSVLVGALWKAGLLVFDTRLLNGIAAWRYAAVWALGFLLVGLFEEYLLRGYLQFTLSRGLASLYNMLFETTHSEALGFWTSALILSFVFGLGHGNNPGESPIGLLSAGLIGLIFCLTLWRTGSLWWALGFHTSWDWAQSFLFGVADSGTMVEGHLLATHPVGRVIWSGGATGPEGSALILPVMVVIALVVLWTLPGRPTTHLEVTAANLEVSRSQ
jgi:membrane protease YdiL (CAAX protease family)